MRATVASEVVEEHRVRDSPDSPLDRVASTLCPSLDAKRLPVILEHLGHERQPVRRARFVERREDLRRRSEYDDLSSLQRHQMTASLSFDTTGSKTATYRSAYFRLL